MKRRGTSTRPASPTTTPVPDHSRPRLPSAGVSAGVARRLSRRRVATDAFCASSRLWTTGCRAARPSLRSRTHRHRRRRSTTGGTTTSTRSCGRTCVLGPQPGPRPRQCRICSARRAGGGCRCNRCRRDRARVGRNTLELGRRVAVAHLVVDDRTDSSRRVALLKATALNVGDVTSGAGRPVCQAKPRRLPCGIERDDRFCSLPGPHRGAATRTGCQQARRASPISR